MLILILVGIVYTMLMQYNNNNAYAHYKFNSFLHNYYTYVKYYRNNINALIFDTLSIRAGVFGTRCRPFWYILVLINTVGPTRMFAGSIRMDRCVLAVTDRNRAYAVWYVSFEPSWMISAEGRRGGRGGERRVQAVSILLGQSAQAQKPPPPLTSHRGLVPACATTCDVILCKKSSRQKPSINQN